MTHPISKTFSPVDQFPHESWDTLNVPVILLNDNASWLIFKHPYCRIAAVRHEPKPKKVKPALHQDFSEQGKEWRPYKADRVVSALIPFLLRRRKDRKH